MIIDCPNCKKKFKIDPTLIPAEGRNLKCGSCDHVWLYKIKDDNSEPLSLNETFINNEVETDLVDEKIVKIKRPISINKTIKRKEENTSNKFFSYLVVFIVSLLALIILLDTLKTPLINIFPSLEFILFNLFETMQDIKLFIIDLY
jgi:predicted Zn finger-like uncharacterized protein